MELAAKQIIADALLRSGASKVGFAASGPIEQQVMERFRQWLADGRHASMDYLERHADLRSDPASLLPGCKTVIVAAFNYFHTDVPSADSLSISRYAHGEDYHKVLRRRLRPVARLIADRFGACSRICVDTAPLLERYWAQRAGVGFVGRNRQLIVPGHGSYFFLAAILTDLAVEPDPPCLEDCDGCMKCVRSCPGGALDGDFGLDCRRCLSYLTIEHRGPFPDGTDLKGHFYGCDVCQEVCPHNADASDTAIADFHLRPELARVTASQILSLTPESYADFVARSPMSRAPLHSLLRNLPPNTSLPPDEP